MYLLSFYYGKKVSLIPSTLLQSSWKSAFCFLVWGICLYTHFGRHDLWIVFIEFYFKVILLFSNVSRYHLHGKWLLFSINVRKFKTLTRWRSGRESSCNEGDAGVILGQEDPLEDKMEPTPVFLPGKSHGQRSLACYSPWGCKESDTTARLTLYFPLLNIILVIILFTEFYIWISKL